MMIVSFQFEKESTIWDWSLRPRMIAAQMRLNTTILRPTCPANVLLPYMAKFNLFSNEVRPCAYRDVM